MILLVALYIRELPLHQMAVIISYMSPISVHAKLMCMIHCGEKLKGLSKIHFCPRAIRHLISGYLETGSMFNMPKLALMATKKKGRVTAWLTYSKPMVLL